MSERNSFGKDLISSTNARPKVNFRDKQVGHFKKTGNAGEPGGSGSAVICEVRRDHDGGLRSNGNMAHFSHNFSSTPPVIGRHVSLDFEASAIPGKGEKMSCVIEKVDAVEPYMCEPIPKPRSDKIAEGEAAAMSQEKRHVVGGKT